MLLQDFSMRNFVRATRSKYNRLLATLILVYLFSPFLADRSIGSLIMSLIFLGGIVVVVHQIQKSRWTLRLHIGLLSFGLTMKTLSNITLASPQVSFIFGMLSALIFLAFLSLSIYLILWELTFSERITPDIIKGGICVYFLIGFLWSVLYDIIFSFDADSIHASFKAINRSDLIYFSFTTLTTTGYGDIIPVSQVARVLANLEGMIGVMYPAVFIARLVSLHSRN